MLLRFWLIVHISMHFAYVVNLHFMFFSLVNESNPQYHFYPCYKIIFDSLKTLNSQE
ncbi:F23 [Felid gammaherpesvirus 1]|uniref:F23 n=1 Tax=Felid gammaherpesvirus 1 TaxID=2560468 RepID=A0A0M4LR46_9GAMA|nr:F23 [Felis catus gammaherpesvirus 1]ALE14787.1 F23 [Felis catus gammaherpesvirus 1]